jgi:hypothetical protein
MRRRIWIGLGSLLALVLAGTAFGAVEAGGATVHYVNLAAPSFMGHDGSVHNGNVCGAPVPLQIGTENRGDLNNGKGSFIQFVTFPQGVTIHAFRLYANDNDNQVDSYAYLIRKKITPGLSPAKAGYVVMATVHTAGAVNDVLRRFETKSISRAVVDNTRFMYYVELVNCATTVEPFAVQILYS